MNLIPDKDGVVLDYLLLDRVGAAAVVGSGGGGVVAVRLVALAAVALEALVPLDVGDVQAPVDVMERIA